MKVIDTGIVYTNPKPYLRTIHAIHPSIVDYGDGELLCAFNLGAAPESIDFLTYQSRSLDNGKTWQLEGRMIPLDTPRPSCHAMRLTITSTGLIAFGGRWWRDDPEQGLVLNRENFSFVPMDFIMINSQDKGKTWTWPKIVEPPLESPGFEICHSIVELPNGNWLAPTSLFPGFEGQRPNGRKAVVFISEDKGASWKDYGVAFDGTDEGVMHFEISVCHLQGDDVLAIAWAYHEASGEHFPNRFAISHDGGRTFSPHAEIGIKGQTCKALPLRDGKILLIYRRNDKPGMWTALFDFDGTKWTQLDETLVWGGNLANPGMIGEGVRTDELSALKCGYPQVLQLASGEVFAVFWCFEDWNLCIRWAKIDAVSA